MNYEEKNADIETAGPDVKQSPEPETSKPVGQEHQTGTNSQFEAQTVASREPRSADQAPDALSEATAESPHIVNGKDERQLPVLEPIAGKSAHSPGEPAPAFSGPKRDMLLIDQMIGTSQGTRFSEDLQSKRACGAIDLYESFEPTDAAESILGRVSIALMNASMDCLDRAASPGQPAAAREIELKLGVKLASSLTEVLTLMDKHRGLGRQNVNVGSVNVGTGGRAIVGNVGSPKRKKKPAMVHPEQSSTTPKKDEP